MAAHWRLKEFLANERGVAGATEARKRMVEAGHQISLQAVYELLGGPPKQLRLETAQAVCDAFYCRLEDFCRVLPAAAEGRLRPVMAERARARLASGKTAPSPEDGGPSDPRKVRVSSFFPAASKFKPATGD